MKHLIILIGMLCLQFTIYSQRPDDLQWLITDDGYQQGNTWMAQPNSYTDIGLLNVTFPNNTITDINGNSNITRNDFFIIFDNGEHYNGRPPSSPTSTPPNTPPEQNPLSPPANSNGITGYNITIPSGKEIDYCYYSNIYEEDDAEEMVVDVLSIPTGPNVTIAGYGITPTIPTKAITANHDVVKNKDITLIFDLDSIVESCQNYSYNLCFEVPQGNSTTNFDYSEITLNPVFNNLAAIGLDYGIMDGNCIRNIVFDISMDFAYLNLGMPLNIGNHKNETMKFTLESSNDSSCNLVHTETILDSHDPNFIQVMCVSEKCGYNIVKYHIECVNEGIPTDLTMALTLPYDFIDVSITDSKINSTGEDTGLGNDSGQVYDRSILFEFGPQLQVQESAYVEFCVKYANGIDVQTANLQPIYPYTDFGGTVYAMEEFRDLVNRIIIKNPPEYTSTIDRPVTTDCGCGYSCCSGFCCWLRNLFGLKQTKQEVVKTP